MTSQEMYNVYVYRCVHVHACAKVTITHLSYVMLRDCERDNKSDSQLSNCCISGGAAWLGIN